MHYDYFATLRLNKEKNMRRLNIFKYKHVSEDAIQSGFTELITSHAVGKMGN